MVYTKSIMEQRLVNFSIFSSHPEELKRFLSEVLSLDIVTGPGLFRVELADMSIDVYFGESAPMRFTWHLDPDLWQNLGARWEFFRFRYAEGQPTREDFFDGTRFVTPDGHCWFMQFSQLVVKNEKPSISVRNC